VPIPLARPETFHPATVVTTPDADTLRMQLFPESATNMLLLDGSWMMNVGEENRALVSTPSAKLATEVDPASRRRNPYSEEFRETEDTE